MSHALLIIGVLVVICVIGVTAMIKRQLANVKKLIFCKNI